MQLSDIPHILTILIYVTLCNNSILLTSAHCAGIFKEAGVYLGGTTSDGQGSTFFEVEAEFPHPNYGMCNLIFSMYVIIYFV